MIRWILLLLLLGLILPGCDKMAMIEQTQAKAEAGDAEAQNELGRLYFYGAGMPQDNVRAYAWTALSEAGGFPDAKGNRENIAKGMTEADVEKAEKLVVKLGKLVEANRKAAAQAPEKTPDP